MEDNLITVKSCDKRELIYIHLCGKDINGIFIEPDWISDTFHTILSIYRNISQDKKYIKNFLNILEKIEGYGQRKYENQNYVDYTSHFDDSWMCFEKMKDLYVVSVDGSFKNESFDIILNYISIFDDDILNLSRQIHMDEMEEMKKGRNELKQHMKDNPFPDSMLESEEDIKERTKDFVLINKNEYCWMKAHGKVEFAHTFKPIDFCYHNKEELLIEAGNDKVLLDLIVNCGRMCSDSYWLICIAQKPEKNGYNLDFNPSKQKNVMKMFFVYLMSLYIYETEPLIIDRLVMAYYLTYIKISDIKDNYLQDENYGSRLAKVVKYFKNTNFKFLHNDEFQRIYDSVLEMQSEKNHRR